jgi:hypothetical protein
MGMNAPGNDDKRFVLDVLQWLLGAEREKEMVNTSCRRV